LPREEDLSRSAPLANNTRSLTSRAAAAIARVLRDPTGAACLVERRLAACET